MFKHSGGEATHIQKLEQKQSADDSDISCDSSNGNGDMDE